MANQGKKDFKDILFQEAFYGIKSDLRLTLMLLAFFLFFALFVYFILGIRFFFAVFVIFFIWILLYLSHNHTVRKIKDTEKLHRFHLRNTFIDLLLLTVVIHYLGGVEWIGAIFYMAILAWASNLLLKKQVLVLSFFAIFFYSTLAFLEYFEFLPHREVFGPSAGFYQNPVYIAVQVLTLAAVFCFIAQSYGNFSEAFREKQEKLIESQKEVEEAKTVLKIKVEARTKELKELAESLDEQVKQRTKELQSRVDELEKFHRLTVGRELKMIELKEEIKKLKEKPKRSSK